MSEMADNHHVDFKEIAIQSCLILATIGLYIGAYTYLELSFTISLIFITLSWFFDVAIKKNFGFGLTTAPADLSLAALAFSVSYAVNLLASPGLISFRQAVILSVIVGVTWIGNLIVCRGFISPNILNNPGRWYWRYYSILGLAVVFSIASISIALFPHFGRMP